MNRPLIAIVGRPNVGKSTLFNRLMGQRIAIVEDLPGVTRDRNYGNARICGKPVTIVDTGGFDANPEDHFVEVMRDQVKVAIREAQIIILLLDGRDGLTVADHDMATMFRGIDKPVLYVVNKVDGPGQEPMAYEFYQLGIEELHMISASHGDGVRDLLDRIAELLPPLEELEELLQPDENLTTVAVVGRPNVGKSTLINGLIGEDRLLTSDIPGTTRDSIDTLVSTSDGRRYLFIDTAGIRRKARIDTSVERYSVLRAMASIQRAQVVLLVLDTTKELADQDARIAAMAHDQGKAYGILANKWDLVEKDSKTALKYEKELKERLPFINHAPVLFISALTGQRVRKVADLVDEVKQDWSRRVPTAELNTFITTVIEKHQPPTLRRNKRLKFFFVVQAGTCPPTFVFSTNFPDKVPESYKRYLLNQIREKYAFKGTPLVLKFRPRQRDVMEHNEELGWKTQNVVSETGSDPDVKAALARHPEYLLYGPDGNLYDEPELLEFPDTPIEEEDFSAEEDFSGEEGDLEEEKDEDLEEQWEEEKDR